MLDHSQIEWWHSIDLGHGVVTRGHKSAELLDAEFSRLQLGRAQLEGRTVLDIGCNDGYMCLRCERLGASATGIDAICRDGMRLVRRELKPRFRFHVMDLLSPSFNELGRFDVVLHLGVLYHTVYPFEHMTRIARACATGGLAFVETEYYNLRGHENDATLFFNYRGTVVPDLTSPAFPSIPWILETMGRVGFVDVTVLHRAGDEARGRVTVRGRYEPGAASPFLYAAEQAGA